MTATMPSGTAVIFTCDHCATEFFPEPPPRRSAFTAEPTPGDPHVCIVGASCVADFVANGFTIVPGIVDGTNEPGVFCPHIEE